MRIPLVFFSFSWVPRLHSVSTPDRYSPSGVSVSVTCPLNDGSCRGCPSRPAAWTTGRGARSCRCAARRGPPPP
eukprot:913802-Prorocentrum_minimum.AAC.1